MVKDRCAATNLPGNYGSHTLRQTFGFMPRTKYGVAWEVLAKRYKHSLSRTTVRYLGISDEEVSWDIVV